MNFPSLHGNWLDLIILIVVLFSILGSLNKKFWVVLTDFISFLASLLIALKFYRFAAGFLINNFSLPHSFANALGFLITAGVTEMALGLILIFLLGKVSYKFWRIRYQSLLNIIPSLGEALVVIAFVLTLALALPITPKIKEDITSSKIGGLIVSKTAGIEKNLNEIFGGVVEEGINYLTVEPGSGERIPLNIGKRELSVDGVSERGMFALVNEERVKRGIKELSWFEEAIPLARSYAMDMWTRNYFGHYSPEGEDVVGRLEKAGIKFNIVGENLALAPTLPIAMNGLMNSEGHRKNILDTNFKKVGIGVVDNKIYGKIFVQEFVD